MDKKAVLDDFFTWFTEIGKREVIVRAYRQVIASGIIMTAIKAYTFSPDGALRYFEYQCCEPLDQNVGNLIKMIGSTPHPEKTRATSIDEFTHWPEVFPLFMEHKPIVACHYTGVNRQTLIPAGSIDMLTHFAMAFACLQAGGEHSMPAWRDNCRYILRRWGAMLKQQKAAAIEHAATLTGIPLLS